MSDAPPRAWYRFGGLAFDARSGEVLKGTGRVRLSPHPAAVLSALLDQPGEVVTRDMLRERVWPADTFVDFEHGLNAAVNRIREVLGDTAHHPRFIETIPRRGYRLIVPVERAGACDEPPAGLSSTASVRAELTGRQRLALPASPGQARGVKLALTLGAAGAVLSVVALLVSVWSRTSVVNPRR